MQRFNLIAGRPVGHTCERRSSGLPILSTEPLTAPERDLLRSLARQHKLVVDLLNEAIDRDRVDGALEALEMCSTLALPVQQGVLFRLEHWRSLAQTRDPILIRSRPIGEWQEDLVDVLWWRFPIVEPPYVGSPLRASWPAYHTHWTPIATPQPIVDSGDAA